MQKIEKNRATPENNEGLIIVPEDNIVNKEDSFVENEEESESDSDTDPQSSNEAKEVIVADIDDVIEQSEPAEEGRPRRINVGAGVERIQMKFQGKDYRAKRELQFITNGTKEKTKHEDITQDTYIQIACNVIFTQMNTKARFRKIGPPAVAVMIKEFT